MKHIAQNRCWKGTIYVQPQVTTVTINTYVLFCPESSPEKLKVWSDLWGWGWSLEMPWPAPFCTQNLLNHLSSPCPQAASCLPWAPTTGSNLAMVRVTVYLW